MLACVKIYDPRRGDDWVETTRKGVRFSIRENEFILVRSSIVKGHRFDPFILDELVKVSMQHTGSLGFFSLSSVDNTLRGALIEVIDVVEIQGSVLGFFKTEERLVNHYLQLKGLVSYQIYIIGSVRERLVQSVSKWKTYAWDNDFLLDQIDRLGCFCRFDGETGTIELFTRIYDGLDMVLSRIREGPDKDCS